MGKADQFRAYAEEALRWARAAKTDDQREALMELARTWTLAAQRVDGRLMQTSDGKSPPAQWAISASR